MINIAVTSLKGGTGVTAIVSGLAQAASVDELDVVCVDGDPQETLKYHLGLVALTKAESESRVRDRITICAPDTGAGRADIVLWDVPSSKPEWSQSVLDRADAIILVVSASAVSVTMARAIKEFLAAADNRYLLINGVDGRIAIKRASCGYLAGHFADWLVGQIRHDEAIDEAVANLEPLSVSAPYSAAWGDMRTALSNVVKRMESQTVTFIESL